MEKTIKVSELAQDRIIEILSKKRITPKDICKLAILAKLAFDVNSYELAIRRLQAESRSGGVAWS